MGNYENLLMVDETYFDKVSHQSITADLMDEAENRIRKIEALLNEDSKLNEKRFFSVWFNVVLQRCTEYGSMDYYHKEKEKVDNLINFHKSIVGNDDGYMEVVKDYYKMVNAEGNFLYFVDEKNIPYAFRLGFIESKVTEGNQLLIKTVDNREFKATLDTVKEVDQIYSLIDPQKGDSYVSLSNNRILKVLNIWYSSNGGRLYTLDAKNNISVPETNIISIYKKVDNIFGTDKSAIIEIYKKGE